MRALVLGGYGAVGAPLVRHLRAAGIESSAAGRDAARADVQLDLADTGALEAAARAVDVVVNASGARTPTSRGPRCGRARCSSTSLPPRRTRGNWSGSKVRSCSVSVWRRGSPGCSPPRSPPREPVRSRSSSGSGRASATARRRLSGRTACWGSGSTTPTAHRSATSRVRSRFRCRPQSPRSTAPSLPSARTSRISTCSPPVSGSRSVPICGWTRGSRPWGWRR